MRGKSHGQASLPSTELPASGSRGLRQLRQTLSHAAPPLLSQDKTRCYEVNSLQESKSGEFTQETKKAGKPTDYKIAIARGAPKAFATKRADPPDVQM